MAEYDGEIRINTKIDTSGIVRGMSEVRLAIERGISGSKPMRNTEQEVKQLGDSYSNTAQKVSELKTTMEAQKNTQFPKETTSQLMTLENRIVKTTDIVASLYAKMDSLRETKIPTQEYKEIESDISKAERELNKLIEKQAQLEHEGKNSGSAWENINQKILATKDYIALAKNELQDLVNSGKAFTLGTETEEYKKIEADAKNYKNTLDALIQKQRELNGTTKEMSDAEYMRQAEENIDRVIARMEERRQRESQTPPELLRPRYGESVDYDAIHRAQQEVQNFIDTYTSGGQSAQEFAAKSNQAIASMTQELAELKARQKELEKSGMGLGFEEYDENVQRITEINDALGNYRRALTTVQSSYRELGSVATDTLKRIGVNIHKYAINPFLLLGKTAAKTFLGIGKNAKSSNNMLHKSFKAILKYGLGIRSLYVFINKLRTGIKQGFSNLYNDKNIVTFKSQVDSLKASILTLKNAFAAAFRPIAEVAIPYIQRLIDYISNLLNVIGQFMAAITGQEKYTRAIKQTTAAIEKQNKAQNKQLSNLDSLNNLTSDKDGNKKDTTGMFEEVPIEDKWQKMADMLKDMWKDANLSILGEKLGKQLKEALDNIPWNKIKQSARKMAKRLTTLINGFITTQGLGYSIGSTLAEAVNTAFEFLNKFVHGLNWYSIGKFIADSLNGVFETVNWMLIKDTFVTGAKGLADAINSFIGNFHWNNISDTISSIVNTITDTIFSFFSKVKWGVLGQNLGEQLMESIKKIDWEHLGRAIGSVIQAALEFAMGVISRLNFGVVAQAVVDALKGFFETVDMGQLAEIIMAALTVKLAAKATVNAFQLTAGAILHALGVGITNLGSWFLTTGSQIITKLGAAIMKAAGLLKSVGGSIVNYIGSGIVSAGGISAFINADLGTLIAGGGATAGTAIGTAIIGGIIAAIAGWNFGQFLYEKITGEAIEMSFTEQVKEIFSSFTDGSWIEAFKMWGSDIVEGLKQGITDAFSTIGKWIDEHIFKPFVEGFKKLFKINSPSKVMIEMGGYIVSGLLEGLKEKWKNVVNWITDKINWLKDKLSGIAGKVTSGFSGGQGSDAKTGSRSALFSAPAVSTPYAANPAFAALSTAPIPKLATGSVIPANKEFLAVLDGQKHGTNVEVPLGMIEEAVINAIAKVNAASGNNSSGNITLEIPVVINGIGEIGRAVQQFDREFFKQSGRHAFA